MDEDGLSGKHRMWSNSVAGTNDRLTSIVVLKSGEWGAQEGIDSALLATNGAFDRRGSPGSIWR